MEPNAKIQESAMALYALLPKRSFKLRDAFSVSSKAKLGLTYEATKNRLRILREQGLITILPKSYYIVNELVRQSLDANIPDQRQSPEPKIQDQNQSQDDTALLSIEELKSQAAKYGLMLCRKIVKYEIL